MRAENKSKKKKFDDLDRPCQVGLSEIDRKRVSFVAASQKRTEIVIETSYQNREIGGSGFGLR